MIRNLRERAAAARVRVEELRRSRPWLARLHRSGRRYVSQRGNHLASAIAFATVLASVPLMMLLFSAAGYVLWLRPSLTADLVEWITSIAPSGLDDVVQPAVEAAIAQRGPIASVGALVALWAGATWISVVREAVSAMSLLPPLPPVSAGRLLRDLRSLVLLLVALLVSISLTVTVGAALSSTLDLLGLSDAPGSRILLSAAGVLLGMVVNAAVLVWLLARLPRSGPPVRAVLVPAAVGAGVFEVLQVVTTLTVGATSGSVGGALFGTALAALAFLFAAGRLLLYLAAWTATADPAP